MPEEKRIQETIIRILKKGLMGSFGKILLQGKGRIWSGFPHFFNEVTTSCATYNSLILNFVEKFCLSQEPSVVTGALNKYCVGEEGGR